MEIYAGELFEMVEEKELFLNHVKPYGYLRPHFLNHVFLQPIKFRKSKADVFHVTNQDLISGIIFPEVDNLVVTVHDIFPYLGYSGPFYSWMAEKYVKNIEKHADRVIAISEATREQLMESTDIDPEKIDVVYQGVDLETFRPVEAEIGYGDYFLHVGHELDRKNISGLISIFEKIKEKNPDAKLVRIGEISEDTEKLIENSDLELGEDVIYEKDVSLERLVQLYSGTEKLLFPSEGEGFGRPMIESLACDTPVVAYDRKPMSEVLPDSMLVEWEDEEKFVEKALDVNEEDCRSIAEKYSWEKTAEETVEVYRKCLNEKS